MAQQPDLFPVTDDAFKDATFRKDALEDKETQAISDFDDAKKAHKEHLAALHEQMQECKAVIQRAKVQWERGLTPSETNAALERLRIQGLEALEGMQRAAQHREEEEAHG